MFELRFLDKIKRYFRANFGAPFVIGFIVLLVVAAVFLAVGLEWLANEVANYAYFALFAGVVLQLVCFLKYGERNGDND